MQSKNNPVNVADGSSFSSNNNGQCTAAKSPLFYMCDFVKVQIGLVVSTVERFHRYYRGDGFAGIPFKL